MKKTKNIRFIEKGEAFSEPASTGISLHCHTLHSKEILDFVPYYAQRIPIVSYLWEREKNRSIRETGRPPEFDSGYWTPPLTAPQVFDMESASLRAMGLDGLVSITDHDSIEAGFELRDTAGEGKAPISMEWTVPFEEAFFHIGVHNLPSEYAREIQKHLLAYTFAVDGPNDARLRELFAMLCEFPEVLIILNHPIWDIEMIGQKRHEAALGKFLLAHQCWFHAIEVNGFRAWHENEAAIELAEKLGLPVVSGGDRHCMHNNTMINVSNAATFPEFVDEIRVGGHSRIVVTPEYQTALPARQLASIAHILGTYREFPIGRQVWSDRIYFDAKNGSGLTTLTERWNGRQPWWATAALGCLAVMAYPLMRKVIAFKVGDADIGRDDSVPSDNSKNRPVLPPAYGVTQ